MARTPNLADHISEARPSLADGGAVIAREDLALEAAFWALLPGNFRHRARPGAITSRNFAAFAPFHTHPARPGNGNHWGRRSRCCKTAARARPTTSISTSATSATPSSAAPPARARPSSELHAGPAGEARRPDGVLRQGPRRRALRSRDRRLLPRRSATASRPAARPSKRSTSRPTNRVFLGRLVRKLVGQPDAAV